MKFLDEFYENIGRQIQTCVLSVVLSFMQDNKTEPNLTKKGDLMRIHPEKQIIYLIIQLSKSASHQLMKRNKRLDPLLALTSFHSFIHIPWILRHGIQTRQGRMARCVAII
jgi:hypothetical protein